MFSLDESSNERDIELGVGEAFELRLPENPTTGFRWELVSNGAPACMLQGDHFEPGERTPGRGGMHVWQFRVAQAGLATLDLVYQRSFEHAGKHARRFGLRVYVHG
jgi:inhibitor of cysteine peptidase